METNLLLFNSEEFGNVRTICEGDKIYFCGSDIAKSLGYTNPHKAVNDHCLEDGVTFRSVIDSMGREQNIKFISEGNVYRLIVSSKLPSARAFERWLFDQVVPSIRQHGAYITENLLQQFMDNPQMIYALADTMLKERRRADGLDAALQEALPKAEYYDAYVSPEDCTNIRATAKELQIPERQFCKFLVEAKFMYRCPAGNLMPYNKPGNEGLFIVRDYCTSSGHKGVYTLITPLGKDRIRIKLMENPDG
ncbi:MAG: phage antirepressor KilAC domain-containing protein [Clostridia bacterium]|nr:phage antirepressor KilAC domain-containing protein [Clostridia bacterium]